MCYQVVSAIENNKGESNGAVSNTVTRESLIEKMNLSIKLKEERKKLLVIWGRSVLGIFVAGIEPGRKARVETNKMFC